MNSPLFLNLLLAHVIADFYLQNDKYCVHKEEKKIRSWFLYVHSFLAGAVSWMLVPVCSFGVYALIIVLHSIPSRNYPSSQWIVPELSPYLCSYWRYCCVSNLPIF